MSRIESSPSSLQPAAIDTEQAASPRSSQASRAPVPAPAMTVEVFRGPESVARENLVVTGPRSGPRSGAGNGFDFAIGGMFPPRPMGNLAEQTKQMGLTVTQSQAAAASRVMGDSAIVDAYARTHLKGLDASPPIPGAPTSLTDYTSSIPGVPPRVAYEYFVRNPAAVFESADIVLRPATATLRDGARLFLEEKGIPPVWAPITVRLEPEANTVHITTLDGHPLRGTNRFLFEDDGQGGTRLRQYSAFQGSSPATSVGMALMDPIERQHAIWRSVHGHLHDTLRER
ncbi:hypothetical protein HPC49_36205 [Pyxidicoccus fallax]|uniref:Uncharacterized protein n=2 Tax=Pyxidicoccus fallax TaxID=394095 RepID=A0A848LU77_9BACT|nr:hypothetical protein [Pyxidicoccus fallax]NMO21152.1 hypothetical protein [Pyxidicoccus fallax]NPC83655.1 hypothetical protein [Pyxidicoccus fallax]